MKEFFQDKDSVEFRVAGHFGLMTYVVDKKRESLPVDIYLKAFRGDVFISALNISNYPSSTAFYNFSKNMRDVTK